MNNAPMNMIYANVHVDQGRGHPVRVVCGAFLQQVNSCIVRTQHNHRLSEGVEVDDIP